MPIARRSGPQGMKPEREKRFMRLMDLVGSDEWYPGTTAAELAAEFNVTVKTIHTEYCEVLRWMRKSMGDSLQANRDRLLAQLEHARRAAFERQVERAVQIKTDVGWSVAKVSCKEPDVKAAIQAIRLEEHILDARVKREDEDDLRTDRELLADMLKHVEVLKQRIAASEANGKDEHATH